MFVQGTRRSLTVQLIPDGAGKPAAFQPRTSSHPLLAPRPSPCLHTYAYTHTHTYTFFLDFPCLPPSETVFLICTHFRTFQTQNTCWLRQINASFIPSRSSLKTISLPLSHSPFTSFCFLSFLQSRKQTHLIKPMD